MSIYRNGLPQLSVLGGCCGTDHRHIEHLGRELSEQYAKGGGGSGKK